MEKLTVDEVKAIEFNILTYIDRVCKANDIDYYLFYGTLLGAVRHRGFIPWDDDIDIVVPTEQYEKLCTLLSSEEEKYKVFSSELNTDYPYSFAKCVDTETLIYEKGVPPIKDLGVYVDIFPLYRCSKGKFGSKMFARKLGLLSNISWQGAMKELNGPRAVSRKERIVRMVASLLKWRRINKRLADLRLHRIKNETYSYCVQDTSCYRVFLKEWFAPKVLLNFEEKTFYAPGEYDKVLQSVYGDYMKYPPVEQRTYQHGFDAYRK